MEKEIVGDVLLVEDSPAALNYNKRLLQKNNISNGIVTAFNGEEAINYILNVKEELFPKIILLDLNMPLLGGFGFLSKYEQLISAENRKNTLVVLLSTSILRGDLEKSKQFKDVPLFLTKPLTQEKLKELINHYNLNK